MILVNVLELADNPSNHVSLADSSPANPVHVAYKNSPSSLHASSVY